MLMLLKTLMRCNLLNKIASGLYLSISAPTWIIYEHYYIIFTIRTLTIFGSICRYFASSELMDSKTAYSILFLQASLISYPQHFLWASLEVRACMDYVDTHILEKISLTSMAQEVGYSDHYISRKFKSETGESLVDYNNRQKVQLAKIILKDTKLSVTETSDRLAFSSPSYFSSVFKKQAGVSPAEYQQAQRDALL